MKKQLLFRLLLGLLLDLLLTAPGLLAQVLPKLPPDELLNESFADNRRGWYTGTTPDWTVALAAGEYRLENHLLAGRATWIPLALNARKDFALEVELRGHAGGMVWGGNALSDINIVGLMAGQHLAVGHWRAGAWQWDTPAGGTYSPALREDDWNAVRIVRAGPTVSFFVNGTAVFSQPYVPLSGSLFGFQMEAVGQPLRVRHLRVWHHSPIRLAPGVPAGLVRERLGPVLNTSAFNEGAPVISPDGQELYFARRPQPVAGQPERCDIWMARRQPDGSWGPAQDAGRPLNNGGYSCPMGITPDGQTMLVLNHYQPDGAPANSGGCSLARRRADGGWQVPEPVVIPGLPLHPSYYYFSLAADGNTIVLALGDKDHPDQDHGGDLFVTFRNAAGQWSLPRSLGPVVNSAGMENAPFLAPDGQTLYFSSTGHPGYGGADVFVTRRLDDSWARWSEPLNLGSAFNGPDSDNSYAIDAAGQYAYFCSREWPEPLEDIFRVKLPPSVAPRANRLVRGRVLDARTGLPVPGATIACERLPDGAAAGTARADLATARYQLVLPGGSQFGFRASAPGYLGTSQNFDLSALDRFGEANQDLLLLPLDEPIAALSAKAVPLPPALPAAGSRPAQPLALPPAARPAEERIVLNNLFFVRGKPDLLPASFPELNRLAQTLAEHPGLEIRLDGHTDNTGDAKDPRPNQVLSEQRVAAVKTYLTKHGIAQNRLSTKGYGGAQPVAPNDTEAHKAQNRRVEFIILKR